MPFCARRYIGIFVMSSPSRTIPLQRLDQSHNHVKRRRLPAPLGPRSPTISALLQSKATSFTTRRRRYIFTSLPRANAPGGRPAEPLLGVRW
jgi:hypothetical protein